MASLSYVILYKYISPDVHDKQIELQPVKLYYITVYERIISAFGSFFSLFMR